MILDVLCLTPSQIPFKAKGEDLDEKNGIRMKIYERELTLSDIESR